MYDNMRCDQIEPLKWRVSCEVTGTPFCLIGNFDRKSKEQICTHKKQNTASMPHISYTAMRANAVTYTDTAGEL